VYRLQVMNTAERPHRFTLEVAGSRHLEHVELLSDPQPLEIAAVSSQPLVVRVRAAPREAGAQPIEFVLRTVDATGRPVVLHEKSRFIVPASMVHEEERHEH
jgi:hypothetical protein